jgi:homoserine kinase
VTSGRAVRVPGSTANLGAGFDVFGMALDVYADVGSGAAPEGAQALDARHPAFVAHRAAGGTGPVWIRSTIPMGRGLGFSGAARVGGAALAMADAANDPAGAIREHRDVILDIAAGLEGHGDNAAASLDGGIIAWIGQVARALRVGPRLRAASVVVWIPETTTSTDRSRAALSPLVERADVVHNLGRVVQFALAVERDDPTLLSGATEDRIHQTTRLAAIDGAADMLAAGRGAGAWCGWLSGSGPTLAFLCDAEVEATVQASLSAPGHTKVLRIATVGARLLD